MSESLTQAINDMRTMRESYDQIGAAAEAYNTGKTELAANITAKGVPASASETLPELAEKVSAIAQESYTIDGGEMYAKQLFGSLETPNYWNLYEVLESLLSDGRFVNYGGLLLAEYYKGYDTLALSGAGAGGGYVTSDGQYYTEDVTHTWNDKLDGKGNRWVAYLFATAGHGFTISDTNTSPRSIFIGRHVGVIDSLVNGRISEVVVPDGNKLDEFRTGTKTQNWGQCVVFRNVQKATQTIIYANSERIEKCYLDIKSLVSETANSILQGSSRTSAIIQNIILKTDEIRYTYIYALTINNLFIDCEKYTFNTQNTAYLFSNCVNKRLYLLNIEEWYGYIQGSYGSGSVVSEYMYLAYKNNDKTREVNMTGYAVQATDVELKDGWCKPLTLTPFTGLTKANVQAHIFDRLGVNDISTGSVTITLANAVLALFTQEEIDAVVSRTNMTIVGA